MTLPWRALFNPTADQADLTISQLVAAHVGGRHAQGGIIGNDAAVDFALRRVTRHDCFAPLAQIDLRAIFRVKSQFAFAIRSIGPMAGVALVGKDGPNVAVELDGGILGSRAGQKQDADESGGWAEIHHGVDRNFAQCTPTGLVVCESKGFPASSIRRLFVL